MALLHDHLPDLALDHLPLGTSPTPVRRLDEELVPGAEVWLKDESTFGDGAWGGNKVRKLEWIIPEARRRGVRTLFTVGGIGTHWGLAAALYGRDHGLRTLLGLVDQPVDDHVRDQLARLEASGAELHRYRDPRRLRLAAPWLIAKTAARDRRLPWYLPAGGSNPFGATAYVEAALEIAGQVDLGLLPEPATVVTAVGSGGTAAGLALGLRMAGLRTRVFGVVVNDAFPLDAPVIADLANRTADLLRERGARLDVGVPRPRRRDDAHGLARLDVRRPHTGFACGGRRRRRVWSVTRARLHGQGAGRHARRGRYARDAGTYPLAEHPRSTLSRSGPPTPGVPVPLTDVAPIEASIEIAAPPAAVWELVSDLRNMPRWSPQCRKTIVRGGAMQRGRQADQHQPARAAVLADPGDGDRVRARAEDRLQDPRELDDLVLHPDPDQRRRHARRAAP